MAETEQEKQWRRELEADGETVVRDRMRHGGGIATGGEERRQFWAKGVSYQPNSTGPWSSQWSLCG